MAEESSTNQPLAFESEQVKSILYQEIIGASGRLAYESEYRLSFKTGGIIAEMPVKEGESVRAGQTMAVLQNNEIETRMQQAENGVGKARRDLQRAENLYADSVATLEQLQNAQTQLTHALLDLENLQIARNNAGIVAPSAGIIQKIMMKENETTGAGTPVFLFAANQTQKNLLVNVTDAEIVKLTVGDNATLTFDAWKSQSFSGRVSEISPLADPVTGMYAVKIATDDPQDQLRAGFIGKAEITASETLSLLEIPAQALLEADGYTGVVYVKRDNRAIKQSVQIHAIKGASVLIREGVNAGDEVITYGYHRFKGDTIQIQ